MVRVRSRCGTWRFNATKAMTIQSLKEKIAQEKRVPVEQQRITLDQARLCRGFAAIRQSNHSPLPARRRRTHDHRAGRRIAG